jgi:hypothetical protein
LVTVVLLTLSRLLLLPQEWRMTVEFITASLGNALIILACAGVGLLIISRRPGNVIGWVYALVALVFAGAEFAGSYASRTLPGRVWAALLPDPLWVVAIPLGATLLLVLYPTGRPPSRRWRPVVWAAVVATVVVVVAFGPDARSDDLPTRCGESAGAGAGQRGAQPSRPGCVCGDCRSAVFRCWVVARSVASSPRC